MCCSTCFESEVLDEFEQGLGGLGFEDVEVLADDLLQQVEANVHIGVLISIILAAEIDDPDDAHEP